MIDESIMKTKILALSFFLYCCSALQPASAADMVDATDPEQILNIAKGHGSARLSEDRVGDPMIKGRIEGLKYTLYFYLCEENENCKDIHFVAYWTETDVTLSDVNRWNQDYRFGRAYIDTDGDPVLTYFVNLNGGVSFENLDDTFDWWRVMLTSFDEEVIDSVDGEFGAD